MNVFTLNQGSIHAVPVLHYTMELAMCVKLAFEAVKPDCVAVELPEPLQELCLKAASRLPDISVIQADTLYYMCEPCDAAFEGLRCALEKGCSAYCIDLDIDGYPFYHETLPDPYSIVHIGMQAYYQAYLDSASSVQKTILDTQRELHMARRLKELSLEHERILYIGGFFHVASVLKFFSQKTFEIFEHTARTTVCLATLTEDACRNCLAEYGYVSSSYELWRTCCANGILDRQKIIFHLYKSAAERYQENTGNAFFGYHLHSTMKFVRNYALVHNKLMPDLFKILSAARGCVDHNYAYEVWYLATHYPYRKNIDNLEERNLTVKELWGHAKRIHFHLKQKQRKGLDFHPRKKDRHHIRFRPPSAFGICSYPPEDTIIENFGDFLKKKGNLLATEEGARVVAFTTSLEEGIDVRETIRHHYERKLYVKTKGKPPGTTGSLVVIFSEDEKDSVDYYEEKYAWKASWHGEHNQESDMAFYATAMAQNVVGPGICRCEYGGFMMSYPPRRLLDIWQDPDYSECRTKAEVLLMAAIDYSLKPLIVFVAEKPPRSKIKNFASRFGKKIIYIPIGQLSPILLNKIRVFHVLDGYDKREIAGDYIF